MARYPRGWCSICHNPLKIEIDKQILDNVSLRDIERQFKISRAAIDRHKNECLVVDMAKAAEDEQDEAKERGEDLWSQLKELRTRTQAILDKMESQANYRTALSAIRELSRLLELQAKIEGQIKANEITINQMNIYTSPQWVEVGRSLAEALTPWPDAKIAAAQALYKLAKEHEANA